MRPGQTGGQQGSNGQPSTGGTGTGAGMTSEAQTLIAQANSQFQASQKALRAGDFAEYGRQVEALQRTLQPAAGPAVTAAAGRGRQPTPPPRRDPPPIRAAHGADRRLT